MSQTILVAVIVALGGLLIGAMIGVGRMRRAHRDRLKRLNNEILGVAEQAPFGQRLSVGLVPEAPELAQTINQLLDALEERNREIGEREQLFRDFALTMPEVVLVHDQRIYFANDAAANLLGLAPDRLAGRPVTDLVKPAYRAIFRKNTQSVLDEESEAAPRELQLIDGAEQGKWVESRSQLITYESKPVVLTIARDISYRRNLEASLGRGRQFAQFTLESIAEGVVTTDTSGHIDYMNRAAESLTGYPRADVSGRLFGEVLRLVDEADRRTLEDPVERCLATRQRVSMGRRAVLLGRSAADEHSVELTASPIRRDAGSMAGVVVLIHDVTEIRGLTRQMFVSGQPRCPDRAYQPARIRTPPERCAVDCAGQAAGPRPRVPRSRSLQGRQRQLRSPGGRPTVAGGRGYPERQGARFRFLRAYRRRRVCTASDRLPA